MNFAVANIAGKQYLFGENETFLVDKLDYPEGETFAIEQVLLLKNDDQVKVGTPFIDGAKIFAKVLFQLKGPKIRVAKFKAKSRYRRVRGFRALQTKIQILSLSGEKTEKGEKPKEKKVAKPAIKKAKATKSATK